MLNHNGYMSVEDQLKVMTEDDVKQMSDDELVVWQNIVWTTNHKERDREKISRLCEINKWIDDELDERNIHCTFCDLLYKKIAANPSLIHYLNGPESEYFDATSITFDNCGRMFMAGNDWTENNLQMRFCPKCGRYMSKIEKICWENRPKDEQKY